MAILKRHLTGILLCLSVVLFAAAARAQAPDAQPKPVKFRVVAIGKPSLMQGLFYENHKASVPLLVSDTAPSIAYESIAESTLSFYREEAAVPPETKIKRIPVAEVHLGSDPMYWVVLVASTNANRTVITPSLLSDSWLAHPFKTVRVLNFSRRLTAVQIESQTVEMRPGESRIFPYPPADQGNVMFKVATREAQEWILRVSSPQGIVDESRSSLVICDIEPDQYNPHPDGINVLNMIDTEPPPKPQK